MASGYQELEEDAEHSVEEIGASKWHHVKSAFDDQSDGATMTGTKVRGMLSKVNAVAGGATSAVGKAHYLTYAGVAGAGVLGAGTAGIGLLAAGAAFTVGQMGASGIALYKTHQHIKALEEIKAKKYDCVNCSHEKAMGSDHEMIREIILSYIINKKKMKEKKKGVGTLGGGLLNSAYGMVKAAYKSYHNTKGVKRTFYAHVLARHTVTHNCGLAMAIVSELYSPEQYYLIRSMSSEEAGELIANKMKST